MIINIIDTKWWRACVVVRHQRQLQKKPYKPLPSITPISPGVWWPLTPVGIMVQRDTSISRSSTLYTTPRWVNQLWYPLIICNKMPIIIVYILCTYIVGCLYTCISHYTCNNHYCHCIPSGKIHYYEHIIIIKIECHSLCQEVLIDVLSFPVLRRVLHFDEVAS